jgi:gas vesicle protein
MEAQCQQILDHSEKLLEETKENHDKLGTRTETLKSEISDKVNEGRDRRKKEVETL